MLQKYKKHWMYRKVHSIDKFPIKTGTIESGFHELEKARFKLM
jgi:hypothetical protein